MKIRAAVVNDVHQDYVIEELRIDEPRSNEVLVKIVASGICHSDEAFRLGEAPYIFPAVFGHEGAGIVEKVGSNVTTVKEGDHVVVSYAYCGTCKSCREGRPSTCDDWNILNVTGRRRDGQACLFKEDGTPVSSVLGQSSFAEKTLVDEHNVTKIDKNIDLRIAGPLGCGFLTGVGAVMNGFKPEAGTSIAVFGTGTVGLATLMAGKVAGCTTIIAVDIHDHRLETAKKLGATHTINAKNVNAVEAIREITDGGADYVADTTGVTQVIKDAFDATGQGGMFVPLAVTTNTMEFMPFGELVVPTKTIKGVLMGNAVPQITIQQMINFFKAGNFPFDQIIEFYDFEDINQAAKDSNSGKTIKPVIIMDKEYKPE